MNKYIISLLMINFSFCSQKYLSTNTFFNPQGSIHARDNVTVLNNIKIQNMSINSSVLFNQSNDQSQGQTVISLFSPTITINNLTKMQPGIRFLVLDENNIIHIYEQSQVSLSNLHDVYDSVSAVYFESGGNAPLQLGNNTNQSIILGDSYSSSFSNYPIINFYFDNFIINKNITFSSSANLFIQESLLLNSSLSISGNLNFEGSTMTFNSIDFSSSSEPVPGIFSMADYINLSNIVVNQSSNNLSISFIPKNGVLSLTSEILFYGLVQKTPSVLNDYEYLAVDDNGNVVLKKHPYNASYEIRNIEEPLELCTSDLLVLGLSCEETRYRAKKIVFKEGVKISHDEKLLSFQVPIFFTSQNKDENSLFFIVKDYTSCFNDYFNGVRVTDSLVIAGKNKKSELFLNNLHIGHISSSINMEKPIFLVADEKGYIGKLEIKENKKEKKVNDFEQKISDLCNKVKIMHERFICYFNIYEKMKKKYTN